MLKIIFVFTVVVFGWCNVFGQGLVDTPSAHLLQRIDQSKVDTSRVKFLLALSKQLILRSGAGKLQIDSAYAFEKQAETVSRQARDPKNLGRSILMAALIENKKGDRDKGLKLTQRALSYFTRINDLKDEAEAAIIIGQHYVLSEKEIPKRLYYYKVAVDLFRRANEKERLATTLVDLADLQQFTIDDIGALKNLREALNIYKEIGFTRLTNVYDLIGKVLFELGDKEDALRYELLAERSALAVKDTTLQMSTLYHRLSECYAGLLNYKKAIFFSEQALKVAKKYRDSNYMFVNIYGQANLHFLTNEPGKAIPLLDNISSWLDPKSSDDSSTAIGINCMYVKNYTCLKNYAKARIYLNKLPVYFKTGDDAILILDARLYYLMNTRQYKACYPYLKANKRITDSAKYTRGTLKNELYWFRADSALGKYYDAIKHYQRNRQVSDSIFTITKNRQVAFLQIEFETEQKEQNIALQAKNIQLLKNNAALNSQRQNVRFSVLAVILTLTLVVLGFGYSRYRLKQRNNLLLEAKQDEVYHSNLLLQGMVTEKEWLLKEVHHRVKNNLQIVMSLLSSQSAYLENTAAIEAIRESQNRVQAISLIHQKLYKGTNVSSINMQAYVADLLEYLADSFDTNKRKIRFEKRIAPFNIDLAQAVPIGLLLNESVTNAIKYAFGDDGGQITITLEEINDELLLLAIEDNGKGFPEGFDLQDIKTLGMEMMKALSKQLGGDFKVENQAGVRISIEFHIEKAWLS